VEKIGSQVRVPAQARRVRLKPVGCHSLTLVTLVPYNLTEFVPWSPIKLKVLMNLTICGCNSGSTITHLAAHRWAIRSWRSSAIRKPTLWAPRSAIDMDSRPDPLIATLSSLAKDREERDLIATTIAALEAKYDLSKKMAKEPGVEEIIKQLFGRLQMLLGICHVKGKNPGCACGSTQQSAVIDLHRHAFGDKSISTADNESYTAQFEPWFCRVLLPLGAHPVGIDFGNLEGEAFEHYRVDLGQKGALDFLPSHSFDAVQDSRLFGSPEFTAQFPDPADRLKVATEIRRQERRLLKANGRVIHSDAEELTGRRHGNTAKS
jgi:hypothetical protein